MSLSPLSKVWFSLSWFSWNSQLFNKYFWTYLITVFFSKQIFIYTFKQSIAFNAPIFTKINNNSTAVCAYVLHRISPKSATIKWKLPAEIHLRCYSKQRMTVTTPIFMNFAVARQCITVNYTEFHEHLTNSLVTDNVTNSRTDGQTWDPQRTSFSLHKKFPKPEIIIPVTNINHSLRYKFS